MTSGLQEIICPVLYSSLYTVNGCAATMPFIITPGSFTFLRCLYYSEGTCMACFFLQSYMLIIGIAQIFLWIAIVTYQDIALNAVA